MDNETLKGIPAPPIPPAAPHPPSAAYSYDPYPQHDDEPRTILGLTKQEDWFLFKVTVIILLFGCGVVTLFFALQPPRQPQPCDDPKSFQCLDYRVQQCLESEGYSKDQCVILVGGNK